MYWTAPATKENTKLLQDNSFIIPTIASSVAQIPPELHLSLDKRLYAFQKSGVEWLEWHHGTGLVADDMGLGKSCQSLSYLGLHPDCRPAIIVCPASVKLNWEREINLWLGPQSIHMVYGREANVLPKADFYIINYDILAKSIKEKDSKKKVLAKSSWIFELLKMKPKALIGDEIQAIANQSATRTKAFTHLKKHASGIQFIALSGTPIRNKPAEFFTVLNLLNPLKFPNRWKYLHRYCNSKYNGFGWTFDGATNIEELHELVSPLMIRRLKSEVLTELPPKRKILVPLALNETDMEEYVNASLEFQNWLQDHIDKGLQAQTQIDRLKQLVYIAKRNSVVQWIRDYIDSGNKLVVYTYHKVALADLMKEFSTIAVKLDGESSAKEKQAAVDKFQTDSNCKLFIGQIIAAGIGITLTAASAVVFVEFGWSPADHEQAEDRIHRIGQTADSVTAYYLVAPGTIEEDFMALIQTKYDRVKQIVDGQIKQDLFDGRNQTFLNSVLKKYMRSI
jgi:SWI/SNF-related matrix-associated actin-dependent regulator 1 of chromatin subfamily A